MVINQQLSRVQGRKAIVLFTDGVDTTSRRANYQSNVMDAQELDALIYPVQYDTSRDMNVRQLSADAVVRSISSDRFWVASSAAAGVAAQRRWRWRLPARARHGARRLRVS